MGKLRQRAKSAFVDSRDKERLFDEFQKMSEQEEVEEEEENEQVNDATDTLEEFSEKDKDHLYQMFDILEEQLPDSDNFTYRKRLMRLKWHKLPPEVSKEKVTLVLSKLRSHKNLQEMIQAAREALSTGFPEEGTKASKRVNSYTLFVKDVYMKFRQKHQNYTNAELMALIGKKYGQLSEEEHNEYKEKAKKLNFERFGESPARAKKKTVQKLQVKLLKKNDIEKIYPEPKTPFDLWSNKQILKGSTLDMSELKMVWKSLNTKDKAKYILKAMKLGKENEKFSITKEEQKILDEYEDRPKYPATAFGEFFAEHKNMNLVKVAELWKNLPESEKKKRNEKFSANLKQYKSNMKEFLDSLSKERLELEKPKKRQSKKINTTLDRPQKTKEKKKGKTEEISKDTSMGNAMDVSMDTSGTMVTSEEKPERKKKKKKKKDTEKNEYSTMEDSEESEVALPPPEPEKKMKKSRKREPTPGPSAVVSKKDSRKRKMERGSDSESHSDDAFESSTTLETPSKKKKIKETPEIPETSVNGQSKSPKKKRKVQKMEPPVLPVHSVYDYFCKHVYTGPPEKMDKAWSKVSKSQKKEYFKIISDLSQKYMEDLERYLQTLTPKEVEEFSRMQRKNRQKEDSD